VLANDYLHDHTIRLTGGGREAVIQRRAGIVVVSVFLIMYIGFRPIAVLIIHLDNISSRIPIVALRLFIATFP